MIILSTLREMGRRRSAAMALCLVGASMLLSVIWLVQPQGLLLFGAVVVITVFLSVFAFHLPVGMRATLGVVAGIFVATLSVATIVGVRAATSSGGETRSTSEPSPLVTTTERVQGENRYDTAAKVSRYWDPGVETIYLASGEQYLDSLPAAGLAATKQMPLLLTRSGRLPGEVSEAIRFLSPGEVVIAGGEQAISSEVEEQVREAAGISQVRRVAGLSRYGTAALLAGEHTRIESAYVVTDEEFPDALTSAAHAGFSPGPILLANRDSIPRETREALVRLEPESVVIVGGDEAISADVERELGGLSSSVHRVSGSTRYETAASLSASVDGRAAVIITSGAVFSDALSAAPLASKVGAVVLLTTPELVPGPTLIELRRLAPDRIIIVGSPEAVSEDVARVLSQLLQ